MTKAVSQIELGEVEAEEVEAEPLPEQSKTLTYVPEQGMDVERLMALAIEKEGAVDILERLMTLRDREVAHQAERAFAAAFAEFKNHCPVIPRNKKGGEFVSTNGTTQAWWYSPLETIQPIVDPILVRLGFHYRWTHNVTEKWLLTRCILKHSTGHSEESSIALPITGPPKASATQGAASTRTFGKRVTLSDVLGLATADDLDGAGADDTPIDEEQRAVLDELIGETGTDVKRFCKWLDVASLSELPASEFGRAEAALRAKLKKPTAGANGGPTCAAGCGRPVGRKGVTCAECNYGDKT